MEAQGWVHIASPDIDPHADGEQPRLAHQHRVTVIDDDAEFLGLIPDILGDGYRVAAIERLESMIPLASQAPDVIVLGSGTNSADGSLSAWEIVRLARHHMTLRTVPIMVLTADPTFITEGSRLRAYPDVHLLVMPFDADDLRTVMLRVVRDAAAALPSKNGFDPLLPTFGSPLRSTARRAG